jgi:acid phosphatase (class A)
MKRAILAGTFVWAIFAGAAHAETTVAVPSAHDFAAMLPSPPAAGSAAEKDELAILISIQDHRSASAVTRAQNDAVTRNIFLFATLFGPDFNAKSLPATAALSAVVEAAEKSDIEPVKFVFMRLRPFAIDKDLHPVCPVKKSDDSYPSGHTMSGYLEALTLASILPEKKDEILARASEFAMNRLVCGVHHPSDIAAGKLLAYALFPILEQDPKFQAARHAAQAELRKALKREAAAK